MARVPTSTIGRNVVMFAVDTNVLVYAFDQREAVKRPLAKAVLETMRERQMPLALQVCGEFYNVLTRKFDKAPRDASELAKGLMFSYLLFASSPATVSQALDLASNGRFSFWDANLVTAAGAAGCSVLFSEDMADGARIGELEVVNPFGIEGLSKRARAHLAV
jgi:predicted nucleic acid-binding protein